MTTIEIRDGKLHLTGYVNAVERDSRVIMTARGKCVEQIAAGAFSASMADGHEIRMKFNHKRDIGSTADGTLSLKENSIGLYAEAETDDEELMTLAQKGELRGWSFGFVAKDDEMEERAGKEPRRRVKALDLQEVSILSVTPAYTGTSIEYRSYEDAAPNDTSDAPAKVTDTPAEAVDTSAVDELRAYATMMKMKGYIYRKREEQRALEERYNHYHDPRTGQFASGKGGGMGLYYSMGKGRGEVVGASSSLVPTQEAVATALRDAVAQNPNGNLEVTIGTSVYSKRGKNSGFKQGGFRERAEREVYESIQSHTRTADLLYGIHGTPTGLASTTRNKSYDMLSASEKKDFAYAHAREIEKKMPKNILRETYGLDGNKAAKKYGQLSFF